MGDAQRLTGAAESEGEMSDRIAVHQADSREWLRGCEANSFDSVVTDPPYALTSIVKRFGKPGSAPAKGNDAYMRASSGFMGQTWDNGSTAFDPDFWREVFRVLKPGAHVVAFSGTRTYHRMACAIEDAGFEIRDMVSWLYGSGFPKSHDVSKGIDRAAGAEREVISHGAPVKRMIPGADQNKDGWGTALKPALEPIVLARKPLSEKTVAANVLAHGTGALNIIGARIGARTASTGEVVSENVAMGGANYGRVETGETTIGRWPANVIHDGSEEVVAAFPADRPGCKGPASDVRASGEVFKGERGQGPLYPDDGSAARFFYSAKADSDDRLGSKHPTVKPVDLMQYLVRLVTPKGGLVLDPFAGTGTTGEAAFREGMRAVLIEREPQYVKDIERRISLLLAGPNQRLHESIKAGGKVADAGPLFGGLADPIGGGAAYRPDRVAEVTE